MTPNFAVKYKYISLVNDWEFSIGSRKQPLNDVTCPRIVQKGTCTNSKLSIGLQQEFMNDVMHFNIAKKKTCLCCWLLL